VANAFGSLSTVAILATMWGIHHCYSLRSADGIIPASSIERAWKPAGTLKG
jgi:hypothetical protein